MSHDLYILAVLSLLVVLSEWLVRKTWLKHLGTALLIIVFTALIANLGIIPAGSNDQPVAIYNGIFTYLAPLSIFWLLLNVNLKNILKAGPPIILIFLIGSLATAIGIVIGMQAVNGADHFGEFYAALGGMFTGTYTGGAINFNAVAISYDVMKEGLLYGTAIVVDNIYTTIWMILCILIPKLLSPLWPKNSSINQKVAGPDLGIDQDTESVHPIDLGMIIAMGVGALWFSEVFAGWLAGNDIPIPSILIITVIALIMAQIPFFHQIAGAQLLGMYSVYLFLAVIGAYCNLAALSDAGPLGLRMAGMILIALIIHGIIVYGIARLLRIDLQATAVASQANIGGSTSALALARSMGRRDLVLPAILIGSLGNALGTFLGFWVAAQILPMLN